MRGQELEWVVQAQHWQSVFISNHCFPLKLIWLINVKSSASDELSRIRPDLDSDSYCAHQHPPRRTIEMWWAAENHGASTDRGARSSIHSWDATKQTAKLHQRRYPRPAVSRNRFSNTRLEMTAETLGGFPSSLRGEGFRAGVVHVCKWWTRDKINEKNQMTLLLHAVKPILPSAYFFFFLCRLELKKKLCGIIIYIINYFFS